MPSNYENLPVFKECYDLLFMAVEWCSKMKRDFRYTVGEDLKRRIILIETLIYKANTAEQTEKCDYVKQALDSMVEVKIYTRILHDTKQISTKQYGLACERFASIEKHLCNWKKYLTAKTIKT